MATMLPKQSLYRDLSAGVTGVATGLLGGAVPIIGAVGGVVLALVAPGQPAVQKYEPVIEGVLDGSIALIGRALFLGGAARPQALPKGQAAPCRGCTGKH